MLSEVSLGSLDGVVVVWSSGGGEDCTGTLLQCGGEVTRAVIVGGGRRRP